jgi:hypothetical protein
MSTRPSQGSEYGVAQPLRVNDLLIIRNRPLAYSHGGSHSTRETEGFAMYRGGSQRAPSRGPPRPSDRTRNLAGVICLIPPKVHEPRRRQFRISNRVADVPAFDARDGGPWPCRGGGRHPAQRLRAGDTVETKRAAHRFSAIRTRSAQRSHPGSLPTVQPLHP